jgi:EF-P beta-lysylation protein EpmB
MTWQEELRHSYTKLEELLSYLNLDPRKADNYQNSFAFKVPRAYADKIRKNDWSCPLLKQVLPPRKDVAPLAGGHNPLLEDQFIKNPGVLQKFFGRVLMITSSHCAIHCQYCFRQDFAYHEQRQSRQQRFKLIESWRQENDLYEVILSGGDALSLSDNDLQDLITALATLPQLKVIRFHTRFPVVIPARLTEALKQCFQGKAFPQGRVIVVLHINHANEIDDNLCQLLKSWQQDGVLFLNQAVLLKGVNDTVVAQEALWWRCFQAGVGAYYLHQMDAIAYANEFGVTTQDGIKLIQELRARLPGYLIPRYAQEVPYEQSKIILA